MGTLSDSAGGGGFGWRCCLLSQIEDRAQGGVDTPLLLGAEMADQVAQTGDIHCAHLLDEHGRLLPGFGIRARRRASEQRSGSCGPGGARIVHGAMRPSFVRCAALAVLAAGVAAIVWTAVRSDGPGNDSATGLVAANASGGTGPATTTVATTTVPVEPIEVLGVADTLTGLDGWLNTDAMSLEEIRAANKLTVVQFWTFGCRNCKNTLDALSQLYTDFRDQGVEIVGVHSPEFSYEADVDNIIEASADLAVIWPIALDTDKRNFHRWQPGNIGYWPRVYVIDGDNQIRFDRTGDGRATYEKLYETVEQLLAQA